MILSLAWKNIWRSKLRSFVILFAITLGLCVSVFTVAFMNGWVSAKIQDVINVEMTHLQVNTAEFIDQPEVSTAFDYRKLADRIGEFSEVKAVSPRVVVNSMIASAHKTTGIQLVGVDPEKEKGVSALYTLIPDSCGSYFGDSRPNTLILGHELAEELAVSLGSKIVITTLSTTGDQVGAAFRVGGIFYSNNPSFEKSRIFVRNTDLRSLIGIGDSIAHELSIRLTDEDNALLAKGKAKVVPLLSGSEEVRTWKEISPMMGLYTDFFQIELVVIVSLILFALGFGIVNTILMSVMERSRELAMLMAIGMSKRRVLRLIVTESVLLTGVGGGIGMLIGGLMAASFAQTGIDVSASMESVKGFGFATIIYPNITIKYYLIITLLVLLTGVLSAIYPAKKATDINPAEGIRK